MSELLHGLLHDPADMFPGRAAVAAGRREMTYLRLDRAANRIAHHRYEAVCLTWGTPGLISVATYLDGPVLLKNPWLTDRLISRTLRYRNGAVAFAL